MKLLIPVAFGLEATVKRQLAKLGYDNAPAFNGRISVEGDWYDVAQLNMFLRSGERVLVEVGKFRADTFDALFDGVYSVPWENYLTPHSRILLDGKSVKSALGAIKASGSVVKKAVIRRLIDKNRLNTRTLDESGARTVVGFSLYENEASITIDTSGEGLHKRGYRTLSCPAPLKETTAAALIDMTYYFPDKPFADIFCGSGTFAIEAAMRSLNIAPGKMRAFDFQKWKCVPKDAYALAAQQARDFEKPDTPVEIYASDISEKAVSAAKYHAERAGVGGKIKFSAADMRSFKCSLPRGVLLSNPPYGERLGESGELGALYRDLGEVYRRLPDWNAYILTGFDGFERYFGRRAEKVKKICNANIECGFYSYPSSKPRK